MTKSAWVDGEYQAGEHEVLARMQEWGMPPRMYEDAKSWCEKLRMDTHHAKGAYFPGTWQDEDGVFFATSTPGSNAKAEYYQEIGNLITENVMSELDYLDYEVWFCSGLHFGNIRGLAGREKYTDSLLANCTSKKRKQNRT